MSNGTNLPEKISVAESSSNKPSAGEFRRFRDILVGPEQQRLDNIQQRMDDPVVRAEEISRVLPDAIAMRANRDNKISRVLQPSLDEAIKTSVKKNPKALADAIFPILGPAIRKAISATIMGMIQSLNQMMNHSLSIQGLK